MGGSAEETVMALLDFLVDPLLPSRSSMRETISPSQEELVAKQVHAVVLLYNYYHRKQHPGLAFLEFKSFCKMAVALKPNLQLHFGMTNRTELDDVEKHLSLTEKAIMNACDTSKSLDASKDNQIVESWPITKVAVFLVDSRKENCYLFHSSTTQGVWSVIEKEVNVPSQRSETVTEAKLANKKKRVIKRTPKEITADGTGLQQLASLAVKEACGISQGDLKILESHLVYSTSQAKTAVRLYIMQCTQTNEDVNLVPINDVMDSLQGPLVKKDSFSWITTPVVEYFHLLPYADKVSHWLMRGTSRNSSHQFVAAKEDGNCNSSHLRAEQLADPPNHIEAVTEIDSCIASHLKEEPLLNISEQNCTIIHVKEEQFLNGSEQNCTIHHIKEEPLPNIADTFEATEEVGNGNICHLKVDPVPNFSKYSETAEAKNVNGCHLEEPLQYKSQDPEAEKEVKNNSCSRWKEQLTEPVVYKKRNRSQKNSKSNVHPGGKTSSAADYPQEYQEQRAATVTSNDMDIDEAVTTCSSIDGKSSMLPWKDHVHDQKLMILAQEIDQTALTGGASVVAEFPVTSSNKRNVEKLLSDNKTDDTAMSDQDEKQDHALVSFDPNPKHLHKIQLIIASKENMISETALKVLYRKREQLYQQLRNIGDEIALCDRKIETIICGGEDDLAVKLDSIVEGCNELCQPTAVAGGNEIALPSQDHDILPAVKGTRLSEANLCKRSPCQELDSICNENNWMLPTYSISTSEGGFEASITVKGVDFECSSEGTICTTPHEARNSAASEVLVKLRRMAAES
ncbi:uncharacterized protein LOC104888776 isoform X2 [Beta vulgaris subsp. vulgaris]|uniref:uncharacterized protein LOC104888776 isoform X2 n=1 Tax=Beta vulgaris subsp. vulgaris TaxID=3555 RepID=UPI002036B886|nr:uncharacterized protein LOC104888776 isoform X2 [Beta vulgaris subsp. vulgaris]